MDWLRDPVWQQGLAILLMVAGAAFIYTGAAGSDELDGSGTFGMVLFGLGVLLPLLSQAFAGSDGESSRSEDV